MAASEEYLVLGLMSGSSLDGLDLALCRFFGGGLAAGKAIEWRLERGGTLPFSAEWKKRLPALPSAGGGDLLRAHTAFGRYLGGLVNQFLSAEKAFPHFLASHGHTVFHDPASQMTFQLGEGAALAAATGLPVVNDFRAMDVALGGQGAPLAPLADQHLFPGYDYYLNVGGIANFSATNGSNWVAFDLGGANQVFNALAQTLDLPFDEGGRLAARGAIDMTLLRRVHQLDFFRQPFPKSLSNEWVQEVLLPLYREADLPVEDKLHTAVAQLAQTVAQALVDTLPAESPGNAPRRMLVTGGGAYNHFLMDSIRRECQKICSLALVIPERPTIEFKEAILMALMGWLRWNGRSNCVSSTTGAFRDAIGGTVHFPTRPDSLFI